MTDNFGQCREATMGKYQDLAAWKKAMDMVEMVYRATGCFPREELFGLTSQVRRAAVSVPSNIAEGQGRLTRGEFKQSLGQARGSLQEVETQIILAQRLGFLSELQAQKVLSISSETARIINGLLSFLDRKPEETDTDDASPEN